MSRSFWGGKGVLVTGHTGFKGSWLSEWLLALKARVAGYALAPSTEPALFDQLQLAARVEHIEGDVRDLASLRDAALRFQPEVIFHMAAQSLVRRSYEDPLGTYSSNVIGTANVLEVCRELDSLRAVVVVTSDKCYETNERQRGYREYERLGGHDPYSSSKACAELITASYRRSFFNPEAQPGDQPVPQSRAAVASARSGNSIGGGDWATDRLVPDAMRAFMSGRTLQVRNPDSVRPWQHVLEPLRGYLMLAQRLSIEGNAFSEPWNFGPGDGDERSVRWVVERLRELWPGESSWAASAQPEPYEAKYLRLDSAKAHARLEWWPRMTLEEALVLTTEWYAAYSEGEDLGEFTRDQIRRYVEPDSERSAR